MTLEYRTGTSSLLRLKENGGTYFGAFYFYHFSPFYESFNNMMGDLTSGGILDLWDKYINNRRDIKSKIDVIGPQVLTLEHLSTGFFICLILLVLSVVVFMLEFVIKYKTSTFLKKSINEPSNLRT